MVVSVSSDMHILSLNRSSIFNPFRPLAENAESGVDEILERTVDESKAHSDVFSDFRRFPLMLPLSRRISGRLVYENTDVISAL